MAAETGLPSGDGHRHEPFISHFALRLFQRLGFSTSPIPDSAHARMDGDEHRHQLPKDSIDVGAAALAFERLDSFMASGSLTKAISALEAQLSDSDRQAASSTPDQYELRPHGESGRIGANRGVSR